MRSAARYGAPEGASHAADSAKRIHVPRSLQWSYSARLYERYVPSDEKPPPIESLVDSAPPGGARSAECCATARENVHVNNFIIFGTYFIFENPSTDILEKSDTSSDCAHSPPEV